MNVADRVKEFTAATSTATITLGGAVDKYRTFAAAFAVGATKIPVSIDDDAGNWEDGYYTLTDATTLTRTAIHASSNGGAPVVFAEGSKTVFCTLTEGAVADLAKKADGVTVDQLPTIGAAGPGDYVPLFRVSDGVLGKILVSALQGNTSAPGDTTPPTITGASVANAAPTIIALAVSEALNSAYVPAASAFTVTGKTVSGVAISGAAINLTVSPAFVAGEAATVAYAQPGANNARDAAGNLLASFTGRTVANNVAAAGSTVTGVSVSPSTASIAGGATQQFSAAVSGANSPSQGVAWTASIGTISSAGVYTAPAATSSTQTATITATSQQDGTKSGTATVTIAAAQTGPTMAQQYFATPSTLSTATYPADGASRTMTESTAGSGYGYGSCGSLAIDIKKADGTPLDPLALNVRTVWGRYDATQPPVAYNTATGAWDTGNVQYKNNGANTTGTSTIPNSNKRLESVNAASYPGKVRPDSSIYFGGPPEKYKEWILYPDGSFGVVQVNGVAQSLNLVAP